MGYDNDGLSLEVSVPSGRWLWRVMDMESSMKLSEMVGLGLSVVGGKELLAIQMHGSKNEHA